MRLGHRDDVEVAHATRKEFSTVRLHTGEAIMATDALLISPDVQSRVRFKHATSGVGVYRNVQVATTLGEGLQRLSSGHNCDVVYISSRFGRDVIEGFVQSGKKAASGRDCAYLLILGAHENT